MNGLDGNNASPNAGKLANNEKAAAEEALHAFGVATAVLVMVTVMDEVRMPSGITLQPSFAIGPYWKAAFDDGLLVLRRDS